MDIPNLNDFAIVLYQLLGLVFVGVPLLVLVADKLVLPVVFWWQERGE